MAKRVTKDCFSCKKRKKLKLFYKNRNRKSGLDSYCIECRKKRVSKYNKDNKTLVNQRQLAYRVNNKEIINKKIKKWQKENREKYLECKRSHNKIYYNNNKEKYKATSKLYHEENREKLNKRSLEYRKNNIEKMRENGRNYYLNNKEAFKNYSNNRRSRELMCLGECSEEDYTILLKEKNCFYCDSKLNNNKEMNDNKINIDHFIPLSKRGTGYKGNLKAVCQKCNLSKNAKLPHVWLKKKGWLKKYDRKSTIKYLKLSNIS